MQWLDRFKAHYHGSWAARLWYRCAPSVTVARRYFGMSLYMDLRDNVDDFTRSGRTLETREGAVCSAPGAVDGAVWDVGANVGLFAARAAQLQRPCVAFEISPKACRLLERTRRRNALDFEIVNRAFTVEPVRYDPPRSSSAENNFTPRPEGAIASCTYLEAARRYGLPALIKMDIEGGEESFFRSSGFKEWLRSHRIAWIVEVHDWKIGHVPEWADMPHRILHDRIFLYAPDERALDEMLRRLPAVAESRG